MRHATFSVGLSIYANRYTSIINNYISCVSKKSLHLSIHLAPKSIWDSHIYTLYTNGSYNIFFWFYCFLYLIVSYPHRYRQIPFIFILAYKKIILCFPTHFGLKMRNSYVFRFCFKLFFTILNGITMTPKLNQYKFV